jgi:hypothetical protein
MPKGIYLSNQERENFRRIAIEKGYGKWMIGKHHSVKTKEKLKLIKHNINGLKEYYKTHQVWNKGKKLPQYSQDKHPMWKGGISFEPYTKEFNKRLKNKIRKRDNQICMNCLIHREKLNYALINHHINYDKKCSIPENLICLCRKCHGLTQINRLHWTKFFQSLLSERYGYKYSTEGDTILNVGF